MPSSSFNVLTICASTLEELDVIFESPNPVKASLTAHKVALARDGTVLASDDI